VRVQVLAEGDNLGQGASNKRGEGGGHEGGYRGRLPA
jgi:hypothetical protein